MPAVNMWLAPLVYRLSFEANLPSATDNVWDVFPFNNADFCSRFGLAEGKGLSTPPEGAIGDQFSEEIKLKWPAKAAGAERFLRWLDEEMRRWFTVRRSETGGQTKAKGKKGKGKARQQSSDSETDSEDELDKIGAPIDKLQAGWKRNAPETDFKDWDWLIARAFGAPGSLFEQLRALMKEFSCDAETAHKVQRFEKIERCRRDNKPFREADVATKTAFDQYWNDARKSICLALFGSDALRLNVVDEKKSRVAKAICYRLFENDVRSLKRAVERSRTTEEELERAYQAAQIQFTMGNARHMYRLLKSLLRVQRVCGIDILTDQNPWRDRIEKMLKERGRAMDADGNIVKVKATVAIVPDEVMDRMMDEYAEMLREQQAKIIEDETQDPQRQTDDAPNAENDIELWNQSIGTDAGVERWGRKTVAEVLSLLGVDAERLLGRPEQCDKVPMWHQWVAVIEMVRRSFTSKLGEEGHPTLLADQVGLGKTIIVVIYIQVLWHLQQLQKTNENWPNIGDNPGYKFWPEVLGNSKYFMGQERIPDLPILIVLQRTLVDNWVTTLGDWLDSRTYNCLEFAGSEPNRLKFVESPGFTAAIAKHPSQTIVLAHNSSVTHEARRCVLQPGDRNAGQPARTISNFADKTIFDRNWLLCIVEEAHVWRNMGPASDALMVLTSRSVQRVALTATPVFTHPRNLLQLGRILRVQDFLEVKGRTLTRSINATLAEQLKAWKEDSEHAELRAFLRHLNRHDSTAGSDGRDEKLSARAENFILSRKGAIQSFRAFWTSRGVMTDLLRPLEDVLIRRDERSKMPDGQPLLPLVAKHTVISWLKLGEKTTSALGKQTSTDERIDQGRTDLQGFFTRIKQILVHPDLEILLDDIDRARRDKEAEKAEQSDRGTPSVRSSDSDRFETDADRFAERLFPTLEAYINNPSEKLDRMIEIALHHLGEDNKNNPPLAWSPDGQKINSHVEVSPAKANEPRRKIVIYCHLSASWSLAKRVLQLRGIKTLSVNGKMSLKARTDAVNEFKSDTGPDVILLSDVGSTGLNLQRGSVCIFVDHPWSASEQTQIEGRVQRRGQTRQVYIYRLVAPDTADEFLLGYASGKMLMMQVFTRECKLSDEEAGEKFDDADDDDPSLRKATTSKVTARKSKPAPRREAAETEDEDEAEDDNPAPPPPPQEKPRPRPRPKAVTGVAGPSTAPPPFGAATRPPIPTPAPAPAPAPVPAPVSGPVPLSDDNAPEPDLSQWEMKPGQVQAGSYHPAYPHLGRKPLVRGTIGEWSKSVGAAISAHRKRVKGGKASKKERPQETTGSRVATSSHILPPAAAEASPDVVMQDAAPAIRVPRVLVPSTPSQHPVRPQMVIPDSQASWPSTVPPTHPGDHSGGPLTQWGSSQLTQGTDRLSQDLHDMGLDPAQQTEPNTGDKRSHPSSSPGRHAGKSPSPPPSAQPQPQPELEFTDAELEQWMQSASSESSRANCDIPIGSSDMPPRKQRRRNV